MIGISEPEIYFYGLTPFMSFMKNFSFKHHEFQSFDPIYHYYSFSSCFYLKCDFCLNSNINCRETHIGICRRI